MTQFYTNEATLQPAAAATTTIQIPEDGHITHSRAIGTRWMAVRLVRSATAADAAAIKHTLVRQVCSYYCTRYVLFINRHAC